MNWIQHPVTLTGNKVILVPLDSSHFPALLEIGRQEAIWEFMAINGATSDMLLLELKAALLKKMDGDQYPFTIIDKMTGQVIGTTRLMNVFHEHKKLEIGWTWYHPKYWGTGYNIECKLLLLTYCFEVLQTVRVQFMAGEVNKRSRKAILKIGATYEGMMRKERKRPDGTYRNTVIYSIIDEEWSARKQKLENMLRPPEVPKTEHHEFSKTKIVPTPDWYKE